MRATCVVLAWLSVLPAQRSDVEIRTPAGFLAIEQATKDANADSLVLLVASHPDDRYVLPAVWLRRTFGFRVAVLLATRGGGGQNSFGSESGDALERIRTLEAEAGCKQIGAEVWYLNRPDGGFRRSAVETFAEWGREETLRDLVRVLRQLRPDAILSTHHAEEQHGHDLALVDLLPEAITKAADAAFDPSLPPHAISRFWLGAGSTPSPRTIRIDVERLDPGLGVTLRRLAYDILRTAHLSPGPPAPIDSVFDAEMRFEPQGGVDLEFSAIRPLALPSVLDPQRWPGVAKRAVEIDGFLRLLPARIARGESLLPEIAAMVIELRSIRSSSSTADSVLRLDRRIAALEQLLAVVAGVQFEVDLPSGTIAVAGEELVAVVRVHVTVPRAVRWRAEGLDGVDARIESESGEDQEATTDRARVSLTLRIPRDSGSPEATAARFHSQRYVPPVRIRIHAAIEGVELPMIVALPVTNRPPVEMHVVPRMLLLPKVRTHLQFSVGITRNSQFPIASELEVHGTAGYAMERERLEIALDNQRSDTFSFRVQAPVDRKPGVDVLRIRLGANRIDLPVHKVDVSLPSNLRVGLVRSGDETLTEVLGSGGLGIHWSELSDADIAVADLTNLDTIVVDVRALRDRPSARSAFRRLLDFSATKGHRLVVFYQKDVEFHPPREGFLGAPHTLFQIGKNRVTRADAPVHVLLPAHTLLRHPNVIQPGDWDGWEQERALYLPSSWATQYEEIIELHDPGQPKERGALLYCRTGEGEYVYCALALWRQLKKLHPGAVRLLANLLTPLGRT